MADKKDPGFTKEFTTRVKKGMSPKERKDAEKRDAYVGCELCSHPTYLVILLVLVPFHCGY